MKEKTCWKSQSGTCIDLIISNRKHSLINTGIFETGLSDHHLLIFTMLKTTYEKLPRKIIHYRKWKNFDVNLFRFELSRHLDCNVNNYANFENIFTTILDKHAPTKTKFLRGNNKQHLTKDLRKAIMKRSNLKNIANKTKNPDDIACYKKQRNLVVNMNRQAKKAYFLSVSGKQLSLILVLKRVTVKKEFFLSKIARSLVMKMNLLFSSINILIESLTVSIFQSSQN